ncbi:hypothetical protein MRS76_24865 [Rhizobiaceae bacterium n13]|uniref:Uncharacterized protein n=1 Tax=Ferirhizobium litorale TaxID=2927786 RepID=A0AAE3QFB0_9HYPH|nr:hypothetical protein [Fererhizobium litorale]MDI7865145.1 hypothetical protein [Fererhizobium litorale]MDI7922883.1 hypothetical protein [Fererhizobium litorale]
MTEKKPHPDDPRKKDADMEEKKRKEQDDYLEEALEETFPASDPIAPGHVTDSKK